MRRILLVCLLAGNKRLMVLSPTDLVIILLSFGSVTHCRFVARHTANHRQVAHGSDARSAPICL
jgi:hypothetical protein